jgi:hopanoid biosynthesis associated protein HpnK
VNDALCLFRDSNLVSKGTLQFSKPGRRRLIVNADDFGRSSSINRAVIQAHREGILTSASLMVNEPAAAEAIDLAREHPRLGIGLHLTLLCGHSALKPAEIPGLVNSAGEFADEPAQVGCRYFFKRDLREQLQREIHEQFKKFRKTGLHLEHVNGHLHLHLHPVIFRILMEDSRELGIERMRLTFDPFWLNMSLASGHWGYRTFHTLVYHCLSAKARPWFRRLGVRHTRYVFGLLQNARVDEKYISRLLPRLPVGDSELYSHPSLDDFKNELDALISPRVRNQIDALGIELIGYRNL